jgi:hypothetical protein
VLLSEHTRMRHIGEHDLVSRGSHELKGISQPVDLHVPAERVGSLAGDGALAGKGGSL